MASKKTNLPTQEKWDPGDQDEITRVRGVVRIDINAVKQTHGWQARVYSGRTTLSQFFSDSKFGGRAGSHAAAVEALQRMEAGYKRPPRR